MDKYSLNFNSEKRKVPFDEKYLATLVNYIDDNAFNERLLTLPKITSAVVKRLEKNVFGENKTKLTNIAVNKVVEKSSKSRETLKEKGPIQNNKQGKFCLI